jgi:hypothetical protein
MKKITFSVSIALNGMSDDISINDIRRALSGIGDVTINSMSSFQHVDSSELGKFIWIQFDSDEENPFFFASSPDEIGDQVVSDDELEYMSINGVCVGLHGYYPRSSHYGVPALAAGDTDLNAGFISNFGFSVDLNALEINWVDRGDDSPETYWLKIQLPDEAPMGVFE